MLLALGLGNEWLKDDGAGIKIVRRLAENSQFKEKISFAFSAVGGLELLDILRDFNEAVIIDVFDKEKFGEELKIAGNGDHFETLHISHRHDVDFKTLLKLSKTLGISFPTQIHVIGIPGASFLEFGEDFSDFLASRFEGFLITLQNFLKSHIH